MLLLDSKCFLIIFRLYIMCLALILGYIKSFYATGVRVPQQRCMIWARMFVISLLHYYFSVHIRNPCCWGSFLVISGIVILGKYIYFHTLVDLLGLASSLISVVLEPSFYSWSINSVFSLLITIARTHLVGFLMGFGHIQAWLIFTLASAWYF